MAADKGVALEVRVSPDIPLLSIDPVRVRQVVFNLLTKFLIPTSGQILYNGTDITSEKPAQVARRGIVRSFQISATFPNLTVIDNVRIGLQRAHEEFASGAAVDRALDEFDRLVEKYEELTR